MGLISPNGREDGRERASDSTIDTASNIDSGLDMAMSADRRECAAVSDSRGKYTRRDMRGQRYARIEW